MRKFLIFFITLGLATQLPAQQTSIKSQGGGASSGSVATGCTPSTLVWIDSSGLLQCGTTATPTAVVSLRIGNGSSAVPSFGFGTNTGLYNYGPDLGVGIIINSTLTHALLSTNVSTLSTGSFNISNSSDPTIAGIQINRVTTGVFGLNSGTWFQNTNGEGALNANYTNATTTFSNTALNRTVISGRTYTFDLNLLYSQSTAVDGWKIDFNGGTAAATNFVVNCYATAETGIIVVLANATSAALATVINATTTVTTGGQMIRCSGSFVPSGAGTFIVRAANNAATTGTLTIKRGSYIAMRDAPAL